MTHLHDSGECAWEGKGRKVNYSEGVWEWLMMGVIKSDKG